MPRLTKRCTYCEEQFEATCGVAKFCSDGCHLQASMLPNALPDGCWTWLGMLDKDGYGVVRLKGRRRVKAHRASYEAFIGPIPEGQMVCHRCDNPACIRPSHLFLGTAQANKADCIAKDRHARGDRVRHKVVLSEGQVLAILADGRRGADIARDYGVTKENIYAIKRRKTWKHLAA
jgi:hypothetical protein